jgi:hypothetical protein
LVRDPFGVPIAVFLSVQVLAADLTPDSGSASDGGRAAPVAISDLDGSPPAVIDWQELTLRATGSGPPDFTAVTAAQARAAAEKSAQASAVRSLERGLKGVKLTQTQKLGDLIEQPEIGDKVRQLIGKYRITAKRYFSDHGLELDVELPLPPIVDLVRPAGSPPPRAGGTAASKSSGLIVDARGLDVTPALAPRLLDEQGKEVYGIVFLSAEARRSLGVAAYSKAMADAKKSNRIGERPLIVKGLKAVGSDLTLGSAAVRAIEESIPTYLTEGRVLIVLGPAPKR